MKKNLFLALFTITVCSSKLFSQAPTFTINNLSGSYSITCNTPFINLSVSPSNYSYFWQNIPLTFTSSATNVTVATIGIHSVTATNTVLGTSSTQTFAINLNTTGPTSTAFPLLQSITCVNSVASFTGTILTPTTNVAHVWYCPGSSFPAAPSASITGTSVSNFIASGGPGTYTHVAIDLVNGCTVSKTLAVSNSSIFSSLYTNSSNNFSIGCAPLNTIAINAFNIGAMPGVAFFAPTYTGVVTFSNAPAGPSSFTNAGGSFTTATPGTWTVSVLSSFGCETQLPFIISQIPGNAGFTYSILPTGLVNFTSTSTGTSAATSYNWSFGDGNTASSPITSNSYSTTGTYSVTLATTSPSCSITNTLFVNVPCTPNSQFSVVSTGTPQLYNATPTDFSNVANAVWNWGDGTSSNALYPSHTYANTGNYNICLTVTTTCGSGSSSCATYSIVRLSSSVAMASVNVVPPLSIGLKEFSKDDVRLPYN
jgi:PKD repeat protein